MSSETRLSAAFAAWNTMWRIEMVEILRFTFESFGHFVGVCFLIILIGVMIALIAAAYGAAKDK
jgi:hypothetical protein